MMTLLNLLALKIDDPGGNPISIDGAGGMPTGGIAATTNILGVFTTLLIIAAIVICLFFLIWGGFNWMMSEGNKQKVAQSQQKIVFAIIGMVVVLLSFFIINSVFNFFNLNGHSDPCAPTTPGGPPTPC